MPKEISLTRGKTALVDDEDYARVVAAGSWVALPSNTRQDVWYAYRTEYSPKRTVLLHRFILSAPRGVQVDHWNRDGLDCRRENLRLATGSQNQANRAKTAGDHSSKFKGVCAFRDKWHAQITVDNKTHSLGNFSSEEEAARAYDDAAERAWGPFARPNFPVFVPGRGVPGAVQHQLAFTYPGLRGRVNCPGRRAYFQRRQA